MSTQSRHPIRRGLNSVRASAIKKLTRLRKSGEDNRRCEESGDPNSEQGKQYAAYIEAELKAEYDLRSSINSRAATALTGSTGFVTLVLAVFAVLIGKHDFELTGCAKGYLVAAVMALLAAAICALMAALPGKFQYALTSTLQELLGPRWGDDEIDARGVTAYCNMVVLDSLRVSNDVKVKYLIAAGICQIIAIAMLGLGVLGVLGVCVWPSSAFLEHASSFIKHAWHVLTHMHSFPPILWVFL